MESRIKTRSLDALTATARRNPTMTLDTKQNPTALDPRQNPATQSPPAVEPRQNQRVFDSRQSQIEFEAKLNQMVLDPKQNAAALDARPVTPNPVAANPGTAKPGPAAIDPRQEHAAPREHRVGLEPKQNQRRIYISMRLLQARDEIKEISEAMRELRERPRPLTRSAEDREVGRQIIFCRERMKDVRDEIQKLQQERATILAAAK